MSAESIHFSTVLHTIRYIYIYIANHCLKRTTPLKGHIFSFLSATFIYKFKCILMPEENEP